MAKLTPSMIKKKKMEDALAEKKLEEIKQESDVESDADPEDLAIDEDVEEDEEDNSEDEIPTPTKQSPAKKGRKRSAAAKKLKKNLQAKKDDDDVKKINFKRPAEDVEQNPAKKVRVTFECDDQVLKAHHERLFKIAGEKFARGVDKVRLFVKWLPRTVSLEDLKEAFPKCSGVKKFKGDKAYVTFKTEAEAKEEFESGADKVICGKKVAVLYADNNDDEFNKIRSKNAKARKRRGRPATKQAK